MSVQNPKPAAGLRKITRLQRQMKQASERREALARQFVEYKQHALQTLTECLGKIRRQDDTLASNNMTIQELNDQVAMQWKQRAEARSDVERATKTASEAVAKHNRMVQTVEQYKAWDDKWYVVRNEWMLVNESLRAELIEARKQLRCRIWVGVTRFSSSVKVWLHSSRLRLKNRWLVRRLNKPRVLAMQEAGYIPEKLIKIAEKYWEADKERINEQPTWPQKWKIWRGRA